jgi:radical SAM superfamily enzyme YgiQ (UPF0313 family)
MTTPPINKAGPLKVAFVVPNFYWCDWDPDSRWNFIPYNICLIAAMIRSFCEVIVIDANHANMDEKTFIEQLKAFRPDVTGITALMDQYGPAAHHAAKVVKKAVPSTVTVLGGVYATMNAEKVMKDKNFDYAIVGEGEYVFPMLINHLRGRDALPEKGVAYRHEGRIINPGHSDRIVDLDSLPLPAYDLIDYPSYASKFPERRSVDMPPRVPYARILSSRGCPLKCVFCQVEHIAGRAFRGRSAESILSEIRWLKEQYDIRSLIFDDDNLFINRARAVAIFKGMCAKGLAMPWVSIATAVFKLDEEMLAIMAASGCEYIDLAIESGSTRVLKEIIHKPLDLDHAKRMAQAARKLGIYVAANFVIGFPGETWGEIRETIRFAETIGVDYVKIFVAIPLPHTQLWKLCHDMGAFKKTYSDEGIRWNDGQIETDQFTSRDTTILRAYEWDRINFSTPEKVRRTADRMHLTVEELWKQRRRTLDQVTRVSDKS